MTSLDRDTTLATVERALRRGEMADALARLLALHQAYPEDSQVAQKLSNVRDMVQPGELGRPQEELDPAAHSGAPEEEAERLYSRGDYAGASALYRQALSSKPNSELLKERLVEAVRLAQSSTTQRPRARDPLATLEQLLTRIQDRRRQ